MSPDGTLLAFTTRTTETGADVWGLPLDGGEPQPLVRTGFDDTAPVFSPDGRLIAYQSNDAGRWEVYVHRRSDQRRVTVSTGGGTRPFWSGDGRWLFFRSHGRVMRAAVIASAEIGSPQAVGSFRDAAPIGVDVAGRLLFQRSPEAGTDAILTLQWMRELRQILGPPSTTMPR